MTKASTTGWAFLVARGRKAGYRLLLVPPFMQDGADRQALIREVWDDVPAQGPPQVRCEVASSAGPVCIVYRSHRATGSDVESTAHPEQPLLDQAGRPIALTYGFVCQDVVVDQVDETDLQIAKAAALATYRRFYADEARQILETSTSYPLRSSAAVPIWARGPAPRPFDGTPKSAEPALESTRPTVLASPAAARDFTVVRRRMRRARRALVGLLMLAGMALIVLASILPPPARVPSAIGLTESEAQERLRAAGFDPTIGQPQTGQNCQPGRVTGQFPSVGTALEKGIAVRITVCARPATVPDVIYLDYTTARRSIIKRKLTPKRRGETSAVCRGTVIRTEPGAWTQVPEGTDVQIFVSSGTAPAGHDKDSYGSYRCAS